MAQDHGKIHFNKLNRERCVAGANYARSGVAAVKQNRVYTECTESLSRIGEIDSMFGTPMFVRVKTLLFPETCMHSCVH